jgi:hypothetical protein
MTIVLRPAMDRPIGSTDTAAAGRRLANLVDELARRDAAAEAEREARRPALWIAAMTLSSVALAQLAVFVMLAPL